MVNFNQAKAHQATKSETAPAGLRMSKLSADEVRALTYVDGNIFWISLRRALEDEKKRVITSLTDAKNANDLGVLARLTGELDIIEKVLATPYRALKHKTNRGTQGSRPEK